MASLEKENRIDIPLVVMGALFLIMAVTEYLLPAGSEGDRAPIKLLCGAEIVLSLGVTLLDPCRRTPLFRSYVHNALLLLFVWLLGAGVLGTTNLRGMAGGGIVFFYWYSMFVFFYNRGANSSGSREVFLLVVALALVVWILTLRHSVSVQMAMASREGEEQIQNYLGYYVLGLLPFALLLRQKVLKIIALGLISYGAMYSLKRGVMLAYALAAFGSTFVYVVYVCKGRERRRGIFAAVIVWILGIGAAASFYVVNPDAVTRRLVSENNREEVYSATLSGIEKSDVFDLVVGHGFLKTQEDNNCNAHNDWLLLQYDYGFVGVLLMLNIYGALGLLLWRFCKSGSSLAVPLACSLILMFCVQMYSMGVYQKIFGYIFSGIGLVAGTHAANRESPASPRRV
jgi:hypothetical protein